MNKFILLLVACFAFIICFAHEYILLAAKYRLKRGDNLELHLFVADGFNIQIERPFQKGMTKSFEMITTERTIDLSATADGTFPVVSRKVDFDGGSLIHLERDYARISLPTEKFLEYLKEDNIGGIAEEVDKKQKEQKERYTRYIKCLVQSGNIYSDTLYKKIVGQTFEIILLKNPYMMHANEVLKAKIMFMGKPLSNKMITARNREGSKPSSVFTAKTDENGICQFKLFRSGEWFIHATHMIPCPDKSDSDWESFWTSYSFQID